MPGVTADQDGTMAATDFLESDLELVVLEWFQHLGYETLYGPEIAPREAGAERASFHDVLLAGRLREAINRLNPRMPAAAREDAFRKVAVPDRPTLVANNRAFHQRLRDGVEVEYRRPDGSIAGDHCRFVDFENPENNDWLALNQFTVVEGQHNRRADMVVFVNGLPLAVLELKNPADEEAMSARPTDSSRPIRSRYPRCLPTTRCSSPPTGWKPASAR